MSEHISENRYFGRYLRRIREDRKLSLDAVEEMTVGYPEPVTKSHLSRIENGRAVPTFPRMFALCQVYGVPISSMAERFETDLRRGDQQPESAEPTNFDGLIGCLDGYRREGRYDIILRVATRSIDELERLSSRDQVDLIRKLSIWQVGAMIKLGHYESCKVRCEEIISETPKTSEFHLRALIAFVECAFRLDRTTVALMGLNQAETMLNDGEWPDDLRARTHSTDAMIYLSLGDLDRAKRGFEQAMNCFDRMGDTLESCRARVNLAQVMIDRSQFRAAGHYLKATIKEATDNRFRLLLSIALSHSTVLNYKTERPDIAERCALRSNVIARELGHKATIFRNCYYLWKIADQRDDRASAMSHEHNLKSLLNRVPQEMEEVGRYRHEGSNR